jgi:tight adherence protein B
LTAIAKSLRAGLGLLQALDIAAREAPAPLGPELRRTLRDLELGGDAEIVFMELNKRVGSRDLEIVTTAIMIQRTAGGNLSEILTNVSQTIRERKELLTEVRTLTSMQRLQGNLTALIPVAIALLFFAVNPGIGRLLIDTPTGQMALTVGIFFELVGLWLIRRLATIEV